MGVKHEKKGDKPADRVAPRSTELNQGRFRIKQNEKKGNI